jgi:fatty acid desaturase
MARWRPTKYSNKRGDLGAYSNFLEMKLKQTNQLYSIPVITNLIIIGVCSFMYFIILFYAAQCHTIKLLLYGLALGIVMIPVYSLIHEAEHNILFPSAWWNNFLGRWLCCMFIVSFSFFRHCHMRHHKKNRTDIEMWDLYYEHQVKWKRYGNLYLMMVGFGYLSLWLSVLLFAFKPSLVFHGILQKHQESAGFLEGCDQKDKIAIFHRESILVILFQILIILIFHLNFISWFILFMVHGFIWSSQNYVNHAFSPRDIINGGHNLKMPLFLKPLYLNFNVHLAHHQNPRVPWIHLSQFIRSRENRISFFKNYIRLWKGPKLTNEKNPALVNEV